MHRDPRIQRDRRSFLGALAALGGVTLIRPSIVGAESALAPASSGEGVAHHTKPWDLSWLDALAGKHRQVFDVGALEPGGSPLHVVSNYLDAHREVFGLVYPDVNTLVGIAFSAFPINASDALWKTYALGTRWKIKDPGTGDWATHNIFASAPAASPAANETVGALQRRGTIFWQCNNALGGIARQLADDLQRPVDEVRAELVAGLLPGVKLVPAHTMVLGLAQEHGCTYERV